MLKFLLFLGFFTVLTGCDTSDHAIKAPCSSYTIKIDSVLFREAYITLVPTCSLAVPIKCIQNQDHFGYGDTVIGVETRDLSDSSFSGYAIWDTLKRYHK